MPPTLQDLQRQIDALQAQIVAMQQSNGLPRDTETALTERLPFINAVGTTTAGSTTSASSFPVTIPANPSGALTVVSNGVTYNLLYK